MLIATVLLGHDAVALDGAFDAVPGMVVEAERIAAHSTEWTMPCRWVAHEDEKFEAVDEALAADPSVDRIVETDEFDGEKYYNLEWTQAVQERVNAYIDKEGSIIEAQATAEGWEMRLRFVRRSQFDSFREHLAEEGHSFQLLGLTEPGAPRQSAANLTPDQRDALEAGYFEVPRETKAQDLAAELDMSHQALSTILRRGVEKLVDAELTTPDETDTP